MSEQKQYKYLRPRLGSSYRQLFVDGRIRAETIYHDTLEPEARTPEEIAWDYDIPLEAVHEAIEYCIENEELLKQELAADWAAIRASGRDKWPYAPKDYKPAS